MVLPMRNIIIMNFDHEAREHENETATFNQLTHSDSFALQHSLAAISESPELDQSVQSHSIPLPQPLLHNHQSSNHRQFQHAQGGYPGSNEKRNNWPNLTFHPSLSSHLLYEDKSIVKLKQQQQKLKEQLRGLNEIVSEMLDKKHELVNEYESVAKQKKCYKRLIKNLQEEYEGYQTMLQADYHIKLEREIESATKESNELKKEVHSLNCELSKPLIKNAQQSDLKLEKLEKDHFQMQMFIQKQRVLNSQKKQQLADLLAKIRRKQTSLKKLNSRVEQGQQLCEDQDLLPHQSYQLMLQKFEQTKLKLARLSKINQLAFKQGDFNCHTKLKALQDKDTLLRNIHHQILRFSQKISLSEVQLQNIKAEESVTISSSKGEKEKGVKRPSSIKTSIKIESRYYRANTPQSLAQIPKPGQTQFPSLGRAENDSSSINSKAHRTMTETDDGEYRQQLSLRKKRIYTELERNMYFKKIQHSQIQKLSRILEGSDLQSPDLKQNSSAGPARLPRIYNAKPQRQPPAQSAAQPTQSAEVQGQGRKKKSIEVHNKYIKQLKADRQALNRSNYQELCNILNRDRLLIEDECEYQIADLIYNSRF